MSVAKTERMQQYGHPQKNFELIAKLWSAWLGQSITPLDVAVLMELFKTSRLKNGYHKDTVEDMRGYADCMDMLEESKPNHFA